MVPVGLGRRLPGRPIPAGCPRLFVPVVHPAIARLHLLPPRRQGGSRRCRWGRGSAIRSRIAAVERMCELVHPCFHTSCQLASDIMLLIKLLGGRCSLLQKVTGLCGDPILLVDLFGLRAGGNRCSAGGLGSISNLVLSCCCIGRGTGRSNPQKQRSCCSADNNATGQCCTADHLSGIRCLLLLLLPFVLRFFHEGLLLSNDVLRELRALC
mmetsp:Transcript_41296/g.93329  ORF Transcript_41296/g.93329 Transcript_41296/m.93329 type:complete len:211 (-) Transcript_41296:79-711(-)